MKTTKLTFSMLSLLVVSGLVACEDPSSGRESGELGAAETEGGSSTGGMTTGISGTTAVDPGGTTGGETTTDVGESSSESTVALDTTGEVDPGGTETTGGVVAEAPEDGDAPNDPAVYAQFRATAGPPVSVDGPLFNEDPLDVQGLQYTEAVSVPGDDLDVVHFRIVPGQVDPTISFELECDVDSASSVRASIYDADGSVVETTDCNEGPLNVLLDGASSLNVYRVEVEAAGADPVLAHYTLSLDAFCFQECNYQPYPG